MCHLLAEKTASSLSRLRWKTTGVNQTAFTLKVSVISKLCKYHKMTNLGITEGCKLGSCHTVEDILGEGGFGLVAKCRNTQTKKTVAVKVNKGEEGVFQQAIEEIAILKQLRRLNPDTCNIVQWDGFFFDKERICLTFELLDQSLHQYLQEQNQYGLPMGELRSVLHQLATALSYVHSINIIHADLKPVNIMVVDRHQHPVRVKVIDFGLACPVSEAQQGMRLGTLWYRAPEMSLGVPLSQAFDMWALGLVMAELAMGCQLYPGRTDYDVLRFIFFIKQNNGATRWRFKSPQDISLDEIEKHMEQHPDRFMFVSLLKDMLHLDPRRRITAREVLEHPFFATGRPQSSTDNTGTESIRMQHPVRRPILSRPATRWMDADVSMASVDGSSVAQSLAPPMSATSWRGLGLVSKVYLYSPFYSTVKT
uniref:Protein kinase domain-containing protein n=1 Tax=Amphiprion ocellaris TaxID=80972 RepID=A0AAQ6A0I8_AMPOC